MTGMEGRRKGTAIYRMIRRSVPVFASVVMAVGLLGCGQESPEVAKVGPTVALVEVAHSMLN